MRRLIWATFLSLIVIGTGSMVLHTATCKTWDEISGPVADYKFRTSFRCAPPQLPPLQRIL